MRFPSRLLFPLFVLLVAFPVFQLAGCATAATPAPAAPELTSSAGTVLPLPSPTAIADMLQPSVPEARMLTLEYPSFIRAGDSDIVRLTLEVDDLGNLTPTASVGGKTIQGQVVNLPNVYDTHNVMAEARLDMAGMEVRPSETVSETLLPGQKVTFFWSVQPQEVGRFKGTVWFYLRYIPKDGGPDTRQAILSQLIEIGATTLFGIKATAARWLGILGAALSSILGMPFAEEAFKWVWKRVRK